MAKIGNGVAKIGNGVAKIGNGVAKIGNGVAKIGNGLADRKKPPELAIWSEMAIWSEWTFGPKGHLARTSIWPRTVRPSTAPLEQSWVRSAFYSL